MVEAEGTNGVMGAFDPARLRPLAGKYGRRFGAGETIFHEDEEGGDFFVILDGEVEISKSYRIERRVGRRTVVETRREVLSILGSGDFFGEMALLEGERRFATATARTDLACLAFGRKDFESILRENALLSLQMLRSLSRRLRLACAYPRLEPEEGASSASPSRACAACRSPVPAEARYCPACGERLPA